MVLSTSIVSATAARGRCQFSHGGLYCGPLEKWLTCGRTRTQKTVSQFVFFGGNGAGEYIGINSDKRVFFMDAVAGEDSIKIIATDFSRIRSPTGRAVANRVRKRVLLYLGANGHRLAERTYFCVGNARTAPTEMPPSTRSVWPVM